MRNPDLITTIIIKYIYMNGSNNSKIHFKICSKICTIAFLIAPLILAQVHITTITNNNTLETLMSMLTYECQISQEGKLKP